DPASVPVPSDMNEVLAKLIASPNLCCRKWVWEQYDHMVRTNSVVIPGSDAAVVRIKGTKKAIAISTDCNSRYCYLDPYMGTVLAVAESARNLSCAGAVPLAITNCLNFGNPENPHIMWQFRQAIAGLTDACKQFGTPITGGNVSFYNETKEQAIYPTPTIGMVGLIDDVDRHCTQWWKDDGDIIILLGRNTDDLGGSEYLKAIHDRVAGRTPLLDFDKEKAVQNACRTGIRRGLVKSAHDISEGGLAVALAESSISRPDGMIGAKVQIEGDMRIDALLFGEAASRIVLSVDPSNADQVISIARELGAAAVKIGVVGGAKLEINDCISSDLGSLYQAWCATIPAIVGEKI
ncbi:MAG TPA: AIR synthase related protein, partial [bacterium]|nr:AIR synthase related protein [bacterium]